MPDVNEIAQWMARPIAPGEYLRDVLAYLDLTQEELAAAIDTSRFTVNQIISGKRTVTPAMALKLSKATRTSVDIWLNLQRNVDLFDAYEDQRDVLAGIEPLRDATPVTILPMGSDVEMLSHRIVGENFPALQRSAAEIRRIHLGSTTRLQVAVFAPDAMDHIADNYDMECSENALRLFCARVGQAAARLGLPVYHFGFWSAAIVIADEADAADQKLKTAFDSIPTSFEYGEFQGNFDIKLTISGGIATTDSTLDILPAAITAAELQQNLTHYRSGAREHLWSRTFRGR
jgi:addiction module HigA family antidote